MKDPERLAPLFLAERDAMEARFLAEGCESAGAWREAGAALGEWVARVEAQKEVRDVRPWAARRYWAKRR